MSATITILLVSLGIFMFLAWFFSHKAKHEERMKLIEKGVNPENFRNNNVHFFWKKIGIIAVGLGCGLCIIAILVLVTPRIININSMPLGILIICCGIALIISNKEKET